MDVRIAQRKDLQALALLRWLDAKPEEQTRQPITEFEAALEAWWVANDASHRAFVACRKSGEAIGMAWLAVVARVPRPGATSRFSGDIQSVFVMPEHRGRGIGSALVREATEHALRLGVDRVTVHSSRLAVPVYERLGFESARELLHRPADR